MCGILRGSAFRLDGPSRPSACILTLGKRSFSKVWGYRRAALGCIIGNGWNLPRQRKQESGPERAETATSHRYPAFRPAP